MLADALGADDQVYFQVPSVLWRTTWSRESLKGWHPIPPYHCPVHQGKSVPHHELARKALLREGVALGERAEEAAHALVLLEGGVALKGLLDQPPQLFRLWVGEGGGEGGRSGD